MRSSSGKSVLSLLAVVLAVLALAVTCPANTVTVKLTRVNGASKGGIYVDPYFGTVNGTPAVLVCDDFGHDTSIGETWQAGVSAFSNLTSVRFQQGTPGATLQAYDEAAYLYDSLLANPSQYTDISFALWALFTPSAKGYSGFTADSQSWLTAAQDQTYYAGEFANFEILTPVNSGPGSPKEFLSRTPEPGSILLLITGLGLLTPLLRKRTLA